MLINERGALVGELASWWSHKFGEDDAALLRSQDVGLLPNAVPGNPRGRGEVPVSGNLGFLLEVRWCEGPSPACRRAGEPGHKPQLISKHTGAGLEEPAI